MNREDNIPKRYLKLYKEAKDGRSRKAKIRYFCLECCGFQPKEVKLCTDTGCPFWKIREKVWGNGGGALREWACTKGSGKGAEVKWKRKVEKALNLEGRVQG